MTSLGRREPIAVWLALISCGQDLEVGADFGEGGTGHHGGTTDDPTTGVPTTTSASDTSASSTDVESSSGTGEPIYDVGDDPPDPPPPSCDGFDLDVIESRGMAPECADVAPPDSFEAVLEWSFPPEGDPSDRSVLIPLVVNTTDDNGDGVVDVCDTPDVILTTYSQGAPYPGCKISIIDGDYGNSGTVHVEIEDGGFSCYGTPAVGDLGGDGELELVTVKAGAGMGSPPYMDETIRVYSVAGDFLWEGDPNPWPSYTYDFTPWRTGAVALHDIDADGTSEILYNHVLWSATGEVLWSEYDPAFAPFSEASTAADLDGDGRLEVITSFSGWTFDADWQATQLWDLTDIVTYGQPQVANLDTDDDPEVLVDAGGGYMVLEHDGTRKWPGLVQPPLLAMCTANAWSGFMRPAAIVDFDGDGEAEVALSACDTFGVYDVTDAGLVPVFQDLVQDYSGGSGSTAFDFLGDGSPEPVYSDEVAARAWSFGGVDWQLAFEVSRFSSTWIEYPIVADIDDDGSAEFLVVSEDPSEPALQVFGEAENRWIQARRIWNQHAYSVTNVHENGRIPDHVVDNWDYFDSFRVNSQIEGGVPCRPAG